MKVDPANELQMTAIPPRLSVIIPVRVQSAEFYLERLGLRDNCDLDGTETILTDDGSPMEASVELRRFCEDRGWRYCRLETGHLPFSLARARNAGIASAASAWVYLDDADMVYGSAFFRNLLDELELLDETPLSFLSLPAVYLSRETSQEVLDRGEIDALIPRLLTRLAIEDPRGSPENCSIQSFAPASAILVMRKDTATAAGGYDETFVGWGGEDRDLIFRLLAANVKLPRPSDFAATRVWNLNDTHEFAGWRSLFRLHGDYMARKGFYAFHLYHEPNSWRAENNRSNIEKAALIALSQSEECGAPFQENDAHRRIRNSLLFSVYTHVASSQTRAHSHPERSKGAVLFARLRKLRRDPHAYFRDSKFPLSSMLSRLFREKANEARSARNESADER